jgi:hypothetical protein
MRVALWVGIGITCLSLAPVSSSKPKAIKRGYAMPKYGAAHSRFTYTYRSPGGESDGSSEVGDVLYLYGPRHTGCSGRLAEQAVGDEPGRTRIVLSLTRYPTRDLHTYPIRPATHTGYHDRQRSRLLTRWCPGVYHGYIKYVMEGEGEPSSYETTHGFTFRVMP